jgi:hypothetical protein
MSQLAVNSRPAERSRGIAFAERFRSVEDAFKNGAEVVGGAPNLSSGWASFNGTTDVLRYRRANRSIRGSRPWSVVLRFRPKAINGAVQVACYVGEVAAGQGLLLGLNTTGNFYFQLYGVTSYSFAEVADLASVYELAFTFPGGTAPIRCYLNGQYKGSTAAQTPAIAGSDVWIGAVSAAGLYAFPGDVLSVRASDQQLTDEEVAAYYDGSMFTYEDRSSLWLPMRQIDHDAGNLKTIDRSGRGRDAVFGAGAAAPTKLAGRHGYDLDGGDYMAVALGGAFNTPEITFAMEFEADYELNDGAFHMLWDTEVGGTKRYYFLKSNTNAFWITLGSTAVIVAYATILPYWRRGARNTLVVSSKSGKWNVWLNDGRIVTDNVTAWTQGDPAICLIGCQVGVTTPHDGRITRFQSFPLALNPMQVADLLLRWQRMGREE